MTIDCGPRRPESYESSEPSVFFEVLSRSTRRFDLLRKTDEYRRVPGLAHFVLLEPDRPWALLWSRDADGEWLNEELTGLEPVLALPGAGVSLSMAEIYEDVEIAG